ncbi:polysaccharide deacetylase family protein [Cruoricaptor ignavus]|uniref:Polysaccharide deacetylase family protein n=1 Tax=Cruoricaptor ignavus TaxID=1118202 RepID=A0A7M1T2P7_9FLAO|nr:polysaccharide deacetylase family protein [Cruoricaptor ignavus]QOR73414.1 polysaccharide deacetylase family protein [Cruoricaptor ignavus]
MKFRILQILLAISILLILVSEIPWVWIFLPLAIFIAIISWASFDIRLNFFTKSLHGKITAEKIVALTFDDGPTEFTPKFLQTLNEFNAKATFFCIGKQAEIHPKIFQQIIENGHQIGNHTYSHSEKTGFLSAKKMTEEIEKADEVFEKIAGIKTDLYRPPFGVTNPNIAKAIKQTKKTSIGWNIRSLDTVIKNPHKIAERITKKAKPGSIILMHDTSEKSLEALKILLLNLRDNGFKFATVSELLELK